MIGLIKKIYLYQKDKKGILKKLRKGMKIAMVEQKLKLGEIVAFRL